MEDEEQLELESNKSASAVNEDEIFVSDFGDEHEKLYVGRFSEPELDRTIKILQ